MQVGILNEHPIAPHMYSLALFNINYTLYSDLGFKANTPHLFSGPSDVKQTHPKASLYPNSASPRRAMSRAVSLPMPVLAPVIRTVLPSKRAEQRHTPPAIHLRSNHTPIGVQLSRPWQPAATADEQSSSRGTWVEMGNSKSGAKGGPGGGLGGAK